MDGQGLVWFSWKKSEQRISSHSCVVCCLLSTGDLGQVLQFYFFIQKLCCKYAGNLGLAWFVQGRLGKTDPETVSIIIMSKPCFML